MIWKFELTSTTFGNLLIDEPIGWADITVNLKRDLIVHGLTFEYAVGLKFIDSGYNYIKTAYNTLGIDQYIELKVSLKCSDSDLFEPFYLGKIFMGKLTFDCSDYCFVEAPIDPSGCQMTFKNRIDQKIDLKACVDIDSNVLPCYDLLPKEITIKSKLVKQNTIGILDLNHSSCVQYDETIPTGTNCVTDFIQTAYIEPRIDSYVFNEVQNTNQLLGAISDSSNNVTTFIKARFIGSYKIDIKINALIHAFYDANTSSLGSNPTCGCTGLAQIGYLNPNFPSNLIHENECISTTYMPTTPNGVRNNGIKINDVNLQFIVNINGVEVDSILLHNTNGGCFHFFEQQMCFSYINTFNLNPNDELKVYFKIFTKTNTVQPTLSTVPLWKVFGYTQKLSDVNCPDTHISVLSSIYVPPTPSKVYAINEALSRTTEGITNDCIRVKSDYFGRTDSQPYTSTTDGCGSLEVITNGLHLRQFPDDKVRYAVSFKDLYDGLNGIHNLGYGFEPDLNRVGYEWLRVEPMQYWYDASTILMQCDNIPDLKRRVMAEWYLSIFGFGYEKWEAEQTSGLDEFNVKREYRSTLKEVKRNMNVMSKFIAGGYSIEVTRAEEYIADSTKDFRFDNDTFIICVKRGLTDIEVEQGIDCLDVPNATDIVDPNTVYNSRISPNRNFLRWLPYLLSNYFPNYTVGKFQLNTSEGNFKATMKLVNGCINELNQLSEGEDISSTDAVNTLTPIYRFETVEFDYPMSFQQYKIIKANPKGVIEFRCNDSQTFEKGFIYSIQYKPNTGIATITLIPKF